MGVEDFSNFSRGLADIFRHIYCLDATKDALAIMIKSTTVVKVFFIYVSSASLSAVKVLNIKDSEVRRLRFNGRRIRNNGFVP